MLTLELIAMSKLVHSKSFTLLESLYYTYINNNKYNTLQKLDDD